MSPTRALALLSAVIFWFAGSAAEAQIGITPIAAQTIPSGKTLVVPIAAADTTGSARSYTVSVNHLVVSSTTGGGINAVIRTGDPHLILGVSYTTGTGGSDAVVQTGTMEFQLLREYAPVTTQFITGLTEAGFYSPTTGTGGTTDYVDFHRVDPGFVIQAGDHANNGIGGPGFSYPDEYSNALIFSATAGQIAMAHTGSGIEFGGAPITTSTTVLTGTTVITGTDGMGNPILTATTVLTGTTEITGTTSTTATEGSNGSEFFITLSNAHRDVLDYGYTIFGQMLRGYDTLATLSDTNEIDLTYNAALSETSSPVFPVQITSATVTQNNTDAVLLLSATGLCSGTITVTASSPGGGMAMQSFAVASTSDDTNDPPFIQPPLPDITAPNGTVKVPIPATDLQLDLLRHGYSPILPSTGTTITSGTYPIVSIPVVSNTDNVIAGIIDHWNVTPTGPFEQGVGTSQGVRIFHIGAGDKPIVGALASFPPIATGSNGTLTLPASASTPLAVFISTNPRNNASSFTASVNWGDSTVAAGTILKDGIDRYKVIARHTYTDPGEFPVVVDIADPGGARLHLTGTANVSGSTAGLGIAGNEIFHTGAALSNVVLATLSGAGAITPAAFSATINWGDGALSAGTVVKAPGPGGLLRVLGSHTYQYPQTYTVSTIVSSTSGSTVSTWAEAHVTGFTAPQIYPPFPQAHLAQVWSSIIPATDAINLGGTDSGGNPYAGVITGTDGNLYGTTVNGGADRFGTAYQLTTTGSLNTLYTFTGGNDGAFPYAPVIQGTDGNFYGTTETDGSNGAGTVYQLTSSGTLNTLYSFTGNSDGGNPFAGLITGTDGLFYGTTSQGGIHDQGAIYTVDTTGSLNTIFSFSSEPDGANPYAPLVQGTDGNFYGTTIAGGTNGFGTIFSINSSGGLNFVHPMNGSTDGASPYAALIEGTNGNFYGTAETGGSNGNGTVFEMTASGTVATLTTLYAFTGGTDGGNPYTALTAGTDGNLYGTTSAGGQYGFGTIFSITTSGSLNTLYSFTGAADGANPRGTLLSGSAGSFYGTAVNGGSGAFGTVFQFTPPSSLNTVYAFTSGTTFQVGIDFSVSIVNSGTLPIYNPSHAPYPASFSVYLGSGQAPDPGQQFSQNGKTTFNIPELAPGANVTFPFHQYGSTDDRMKLPLGLTSGTMPITGVVTYTDPVGDYDGSAKTYSPGSF
jgi:uncharacterized repeat protein (TIGR03803 family)